MALCLMSWRGLSTPIEKSREFASTAVGTEKNKTLGTWLKERLGNVIMWEMWYNLWLS